MKKIIIYLILGMMGLVLVNASILQECSRTMTAQDIPCIQPTSYFPSQPCKNYNISITNQQNQSVENLTYYSGLVNCQFVFTQTTPNIYYWNSDIESGVITIEANKDMMAVIIVFIGLIAYFALLGWLNKSAQLKFLCFGLSIIELILMVGCIYLSETGGNYPILLQINFYSVLVIGFGLGMITIFAKYTELVTDDPNLLANEQTSGKKWQN